MRLPRHETPVVGAVEKLIERIGVYLPEVMPEPLSIILAGGAALSFYCPYRTSHDVDAIFSRRILLPEDIAVAFVDAQDQNRLLDFDRQYHPSLGLEPEGYEDRALLVNEVAGGRIRLLVVEPNDLAVMKIGRYWEHDRADVRALATEGLLDADIVARRAQSGLSYYIGDIRSVEINIRDAVKVIRSLQHHHGRKPGPSCVTGE